MLLCTLLALAPQAVPISDVANLDSFGRLGPDVVFRGGLFGDRQIYATGGVDGVTGAVYDLGGEANLSPFVTWEGRYVIRGVEDGLVVSDGTPSGSGRLLSDAFIDSVDIFTGFASSGPGLFFATFTASVGYELFVIEGFGSAPVPLATLDGGFYQLQALGDGIVFSGYDTSTGRELWVSDGTPAGTQQVTELAPGPTDGVLDGNDRFVSDGDRVWFLGQDAPGSRALYFSDGTSAGTLAVPGTEVTATLGGGTSIERIESKVLVEDFTNFDPTTIYSVDVATLGIEILPGLPGNARLASLRPLDKVASYGLIVAPGGAAPDSLWRTDGTASGTTLLNPGAGLDSVSGPFVEVASDGTFLFEGNGVTWATDGSLAGTRLVFSEGSPVNGVGPFGAEVLLGAALSADDGLFSLPLSELGASSLVRLGRACEGAAELSGAGTPRLGETIQLELAGGDAGQIGLMLLSRDLAPAPSIGTCSLGLLAPNTLTFLSLDGAGAATLPVTVPVNAALVGEAFELQFAGIKIGGPLLSLLETSNVLEAVIGS